jgi:ATP-dependent RNA helicase DeaD
VNEEKNAAQEIEDEAASTEEVDTAPETDSEAAQEAEAAPAEDGAEAAEDVADDGGQDADEAAVAAPAEVDLDGVQVVQASDYDSNRSFSDFPLSAELLQGIEAHGYKTATAVQAATLEAALAGRDMVVRSKTGTGKTAAFALPILEQIEAGAREVQGIVLAPTRELARQVAEEATQLAQFKDLHVVAIYGGVGFGAQEAALKEGAELIVGTPGRILDHLRRGNLDLSTARFAALDEADEMLAQGFYEDVTKILDQTPESRQVLMFSATIDERVRSIIQRYTNEPLDLRLSTDADKVENIQHIIYESSPDFHKARALLAIIEQEQPGSAVIFCNTREDTATVATFLSRQGLDVELISGELPQKKREAVMKRVKSGHTQFLTATDVAARGIDISDLTHVLNYSLPEDPAVYLHRSGRTGRIGKTGVCISLVGGAELHTRKTLANQYEISFEVRPLPSKEEAAQARVERQVRSIKEAMGTMAFEGYLGTVRAIKERPDGDVLLAAAMRAFFLWDRIRKAEADGGPDSVGALAEERENRNSRRGGGRGRRDGGRRDGGRRDGGRRDGGRRDGERRDGGRRDEGGQQAKGQSEGGDGDRRRRRRRRRGGRGGGEKPTN